ncbi:DeoR family transcriptional regulator [Streptomyces sp. NBC_00335]|uniref:DeoR family transcriptional regulator n=1 Tax=unclassified Streptomyces TaxID=2593676 RepID=UPI00225116AA|nr:MULTISPECIES: DeoR family transcriptional regulator [unclassified Streptomyces]MCX5409499.1 DeoR family transcriptional regulator [Streptomyces sp. NBC_00086]
MSSRRDADSGETTTRGHARRISLATGKLTAASRQRHIVEAACREGYVSLERLVRELDVSAMTVHRDLRLLDAEGEVRRVRGGAVAPWMTTAS